MGKLENYENKQDELKGKGTELKDEAGNELNEANETKGTIDSLNVVDEETQNVIDEGEQACTQTAREIGEQDIKSPADEIGSRALETGEEAREDSGIESENAQALGSVGEKYTEALSGAKAGLEEHAEQFGDMAEKFEHTKTEIDSMAQQAISQLESVF